MQQERVLVVNLDKRTDRLAHMTEELKRVGLEFQRLPVFFPPGGSNGFMSTRARSNFYTHMQAVAMVADDKKPTIVLEDDVRFVNIPAFYKYLEKIRTMTSWDLIYLYGSRSLHIERLYGVTGVHGYMVNSESAKRFYDELDKHRKEIEAGLVVSDGRTFIDNICADKLQPHMKFYGTPELVYQDRDKFGSDNGWGWRGQVYRD